MEKKKGEPRGDADDSEEGVEVKRQEVKRKREKPEDNFRDA